MFHSLSFPLIPKLEFFFFNFQFQLRTKPFFFLFFFLGLLLFSGSGFPLCYPTYSQRSFLMKRVRQSSPPPSPQAQLTIRPILPDHNNIPPSFLSHTTRQPNQHISSLSLIPSSVQSSIARRCMLPFGVLSRATFR